MSVFGLLLEAHPNGIVTAPNTSVSGSAYTTEKIAPLGIDGYSIAFLDPPTRDTCLKVKASNSLALGTDNFTISAWVYIKGGYYGYPVFSLDTGRGFNNYFAISQWGEYGYWEAALLGTSYGTDKIILPSANEWHHVAVTREGNIFRTFLDGKIITETTVSSTPKINTMAEYDMMIFSIYAAIHTPAFRYMVGYLYNFVIIKACLYTKEFTPTISNSIFHRGKHLYLSDNKIFGVQ